jgi:hypothetical protein
MLNPQSITVEKLLRQYEEGRITAIGVMLTIVTITNGQRLREILEALPAEILEKLKEFVATYEPGRQVFNAPSPRPRAVRLVREWFASADRTVLTSSNRRLGTDFINRLSRTLS